MKIQLALSLFTLLAGIVTTKAYDIDIDEIASQIRRDEAAAAQKDPRVGVDPTESEYVTVYKKSDEPKSAATAETAQQKRELKEADRQFEAAYRSMSLDSQNALNSSKAAFFRDRKNCESFEDKISNTYRLVEAFKKQALADKLATPPHEPDYAQLEQDVRAGARYDTNGYNCFKRIFSPDPLDPEGGTFTAYFSKSIKSTDGTNSIRDCYLGFEMDIKTKKVITISNSIY